GDNTLTVLTNDGKGGFMLACSPGVGSYPAMVTTADVNGDGKVDLISANYLGATLSVLTNTTPFPPSRPVIVTQPANQTATAGGTARFSVAARGSVPLSYQWRFGGTKIAGGTNTTLTLTNVQAGEAGNYAVLVTNADGSILSSNALLTVTVDHFSWSQIPSPRYVNALFAVSIQARNLTNGLFTDFTGFANLDSTNGVAIIPSVSGNFIQGVWTGSVVIAQTVSNLVLRANDGLGHIGLANPVNVISLPGLEMLHSGNIAVFMWPMAGYSGFVLETSVCLAPATWNVVPYSPIQVGDQYLLPLVMTGTNGFYRLWFPGP
ncbi:MAG: immunoglobulin domain-containing protein, partial [Verrucomicrobiota bacterium]